MISMSGTSEILKKVSEIWDKIDIRELNYSWWIGWQVCEDIVIFKNVYDPSGSMIEYRT